MCLSPLRLITSFINMDCNFSQQGHQGNKDNLTRGEDSETLTIQDVTFGGGAICTEATLS